MTTSSQKSSVQIALFLGLSLIAWKIFAWALNGGLWFLMGKNQDAFGHLDFYVVSPLVLIVASFLIGRWVTRYAKMTRYGNLAIYAIVGVIIIQMVEYTIMDRLYGFPFSSLSRFIGILFEVVIFTVFFLLGAHRNIHLAREN